MWPALLTLLPNLLDKILPDKGAADAAKLELLKMAQSGELAQLQANTDLAKGQMEINKVEAASSSLFVAGWRPFVGWICACAIGFKYIGGPLLVMICAALGHDIDLPDIDTADLWPLLAGLLGLGGLRTIEKVKGAA
ncbi:MAG: hypothetical protein HYX42_03970 [Polaromonas sp.]|uniref:3TM-type holin n=1 Tax=Polaromonas sp. TaxID=1869339 RepID=UPI0025E46C46|nr:3TM-type holin [Polaromonas sp.]MBI2725387.1 hypothetical protein [Polaromonas sp.]